MCGEQLTVAVTVVPVEGSSPRVRGAVYCAPRLGVVEGIIPACAGSSHRRCNQRGMARDHPRVCGEQLTVAVTVVPVEGSSPRVRGAVRRLSLHDIRAGSSPRVRGAAMTLTVVLLDGGIIPACAGSSCTSSRRYGLQGDHPRVCGEQT